MIKFPELKDAEIEKVISTLEVTKVEGGLDKLVGEVFAEFDKDKNGVLDRKEMRLFFSKVFVEWKLVFPLTDEFIDDLFRDIDKDHNNKISHSELKIYLAKYVHHVLSSFYKEREMRIAKIAAAKK